MANNHYEYLDSFLDRQRSRGRFTFTADEVKKEFELSENAFKKTTQRLLEQNKISRLRNKFYLIIPPEYPVLYRYHRRREYTGSGSASEGRYFLQRTENGLGRFWEIYPSLKTSLLLRFKMVIANCGLIK